MLTVFSGGPDPPQQGYWDERCGFADSDEAVRVRRAEELAALTPGGHRVTFLGLMEGQYLEQQRGATDAEAIASAARARGDALVAVPVGAGRPPRALDRLLGRVAPRGTPVAPHPDHLFVRDAVLGAVDGPVLLYEDFPYLRSRAGDRAAADAALQFGRRAELLTFEVDREAKAARISAYASQLPHLAGPDERFDRPELLPPVERYWVLSAPGLGI